MSRVVKSGSTTISAMAYTHDTDGNTLTTTDDDGNVTTDTYIGNLLVGVEVRDATSE